MYSLHLSLMVINAGILSVASVLTQAFELPQWSSVGWQLVKLCQIMEKSAEMLPSNFKETSLLDEKLKSKLRCSN
jgi:hypothetical protein